MNDGSLIPVLLLILGLYFFVYLPKKNKRKKEQATGEPARSTKKQDLSPNQKKDIATELEKHAKSEGNDVDAAIGLIKMGMKEYLPGFLKSLEEAEVGMLTKDPNDLNSVLLLADSENRPLLPIFTRNEYADNLEEQKKDYRYMAWAPMKSILTAFGGDIGLVINPKHETFEYIMPPDLYAKFKEIAMNSSSSAKISDLEIEIYSTDSGPEELEQLLPLKVKCLKRFSSEDGSDYVLSELSEPINWKGSGTKHLVVGARLVGQKIEKGISSLSVNIAVVTDSSLIKNQTIDFDKADFAAVGMARELKTQSGSGSHH